MFVVSPINFRVTKGQNL